MNELPGRYAPSHYDSNAPRKTNTEAKTGEQELAKGCLRQGNK